MTNLHTELHNLSDTLIDIKTVIEASDRFMTEQFKRHIALVMNSRERINSIQKKVDELILKYRLTDLS